MCSEIFIVSLSHHKFNVSPLISENNAVFFIDFKVLQNLEHEQLTHFINIFSFLSPLLTVTGLYVSSFLLCYASNTLTLPLTWLLIFLCHF